MDKIDTVIVTIWKKSFLEQQDDQFWLTISDTKDVEVAEEYGHWLSIEELLTDFPTAEDLEHFVRQDSIFQIHHKSCFTVIIKPANLWD